MSYKVKLTHKVQDGFYKLGNNQRLREGIGGKMNKKVNLKLRDLLEEHGMTQKELAAKAGVRENTISDLLKDNKQGIRFETLARIASVFNLNDPNELFEIIDERERD